MNKRLWYRQQPRNWRRAAAVPFMAVALVSLLAGCDAQWGGVQVKVGEPEFGERPASLEAKADSDSELPPLTLPTGPVLFHVRRLDAAGSATIAPIAEVTPESLSVVEARPAERASEYASEFFARYYQPDQAYTLFREEARVGTFYVSEPTSSESGPCGDLAAVGTLEIRLPADTVSEFLAWPAGARSGRDSLRTPSYREDMVTLAQVLARRLVSERGISGRWRFQNPADLRAVSVGEGQLGFAATFMVGDSLATGSPNDSAGMAFVVADHSPAVGYIPLYFDAAWYSPGGKRAVRWLDASDLVGDTQPEWVLRDYGEGGSWYSVVGRRGGEYVQLWSSRRPRCESQPATSPAIPGS